VRPVAAALSHMVQKGREAAGDRASMRVVSCRRSNPHVISRDFAAHFVAVSDVSLYLKLWFHVKIELF